MKLRSKLFALALIAAAIGLTAWAQFDPAHRNPGSWQIEVVAAYPHDPTAFTQGLVVDKGLLYEGTGKYGNSSIRRVDLVSGVNQQFTALSARFFGEGITILGGRLYQLTWRSGIGFVYQQDSFELLQSFRYSGEGWGLTHNGSSLIVSDGTAQIRYLDPDSFELQRVITVREGDQALAQLNELEYINGEIWANVWYQDRIVRIAPADGRVLGWIDLSGLYSSSERGSDDVLNGIAFDEESNRFFVTGKNWPQLFEIRIVGD